jgi:hypothetical protein
MNRESPTQNSRSTALVQPLLRFLLNAASCSRKRQVLDSEWPDARCPAIEKIQDETAHWEGRGTPNRCAPIRSKLRNKRRCQTH